MLFGRGEIGLIRALQDPLGADVDPGASGHLAVHRQPHAIERVEGLLRRPARYEIRVGDQYARRVSCVRAT